MKKKGQDITDRDLVKKFAETEEKLIELSELKSKDQRPDMSVRAALSNVGWNPDIPAKRVIDYSVLDFEFAEKPKMQGRSEGRGVLGCPWPPLYTPFLSKQPAIFRGENAMTIMFDTTCPPPPLKNPGYAPEMETLTGFSSRSVDFFITDPRGYGSIFLKMADNFKDKKILLNKIVKSVSYSRYGVRVTTVDGEMFTGKYGLCTFSTGVLWSDSVVFSSKLPQWKV